MVDELDELQKTDWQLTMMSDCEVRTIQMAI
jgi:hypothetical protein